MTAFQERSLPTYVANVAALATSRARTANGGVVQTSGWHSAGDGGAQSWQYNRTGRSLITVSNLFLSGPGADDYWKLLNPKQASNVIRVTLPGSVTPDYVIVPASDFTSASQWATALATVPALITSGGKVEMPLNLSIDGSDFSFTADTGDIEFYGNGLYIAAQVAHDWVIKFAATAGKVIADGVTVEGGDSLGITTAATRGEGIRILAGGVESSRVTKCRAQNAPGGGGANNFYSVCNSLYMKDCIAQNPGWANYRIDGNTGTTVLENCESIIDTDKFLRVGVLHGDNRFFTCNGAGGGTLSILNNRWTSSVPLCKSVIDPGEGAELSQLIVDGLKCVRTNVDTSAIVSPATESNVLKVEACRKAIIRNCFTKDDSTTGEFYDLVVSGMDTQPDAPQCETLIENCVFDGWINLVGEPKTITIRNSRFGESRPIYYMLSNITVLESLVIEDCTVNNMILDQTFFALTATWTAFTAVAATDVITSVAHGLSTNSEIYLRGDNLPGGLVARRPYWVQKIDNDTFRLVMYSPTAASPQGPSVAFTANDTTDYITPTTSRPLALNRIVRFTGADLPAPLVAATDYFVVLTDANKFKVSATEGGAAIDITDAGSGAMTFTAEKVNITDAGSGTIQWAAGGGFNFDSVKVRIRNLSVVADRASGPAYLFTSDFPEKIGQVTVNGSLSLSNKDVAGYGMFPANINNQRLKVTCREENGPMFFDETLGTSFASGANDHPEPPFTSPSAFTGERGRQIVNLNYPNTDYTDAAGDLIERWIWNTRTEEWESYAPVAASEFIMSWKTDNAGTSTSSQITLPFIAAVSGGSYNCVVDWGDSTTDTITAYNDAAATHTYASPGTYTVKIKGLCKGIYFGNGGDCLKLLNISNWGPATIVTSGAFYGCANLTITATDRLIFDMASNPATIENMFNGCTSLTTIPGITTWNLVNVNSMRLMFNGCTSFNQALAGLDVSAITRFDSTFSGCTSFNGDVSDWDTSSCTLMTDMFYGCTVFNQDLSAWDVSLVTNFDRMFRNCDAFTSDLSAWDTSSATSMVHMFYQAFAFNSDLSGWDISNATDMTLMLFQSVFSNVNYDATLIAWSALTVQNSVTFNAGPAQYSAGAATTARGVLTGTYSWSISDGGAA